MSSKFHRFYILRTGNRAGNPLALFVFAEYGTDLRSLHSEEKGVDEGPWWWGTKSWFSFELRYLAYIYIKISPNTACAMIMPPMKYRSDNEDFGLTVT
jgi:hypothetical protein